MPRPPQLLDSTLREGEQAAGVLFTPQAKLEIARELDAFGIDIIEVGHPAVSAETAAAARRIANEGLNAHTLAHARARIEDVDLARASDVDWVGIFHAVRDEALRDRFHCTLNDALERIQAAIQHAKDHGLLVRFTPEDTIRTHTDNLRAAVHAARDAGADRISIADTTGSAHPAQISRFVRFVRQESGLDVHVHCHNDLGLAAANALSGIEAGARVVDVTVNGIGERTGIADLATTALLIARHVDCDIPWDLTRLPALASLVARESGMGVHPLAPVTGANAFAHKAGLHVAAVTRDPNHFEAFPPAMVGRTRSITLDRYAGLATLQHKCRELGITADEDTLRSALKRIKTTPGTVSDEAFVQLVASTPRAPTAAARPMAA